MEDSPADDVDLLITMLQSKGIVLWPESNQLRFQAPKGSLTTEDKDRLRAAKAAVVARLIDKSYLGKTEPGLLHRAPQVEVPLAFSQHYRWRLLSLHNRPSVRSLARARLLEGAVNVQALNQALNALGRAHDALRTRILVSNSEPKQQIGATLDLEICFHDWVNLSPAPARTEIDSLIAQSISLPVNLGVDPPLSATLVRIQERQYIFLLAADHMICDALSMDILFSDLWCAYSYIAQGRTPNLPETPIQYSDYALWQAEATPFWTAKYGHFWRDRIDLGINGRLPRYSTAITGAPRGWGSVPVYLDPGTRYELVAWSRRAGTTLSMSLLTAYAALLLQWTARSEIVIQYQTDGRSDPKLKRTVGYLASLICLRISDPNLRLIDLLRQITEDFCLACEHGDLSYMATQIRRTDFLRNTTFNWVPERTSTQGLISQNGSHSITQSPWPIEVGLSGIDCDHDPELMLFDSTEGVSGGLYFPLDQFSLPTMERLAKSLMTVLQALLHHPEWRVRQLDLT